MSARRDSLGRFLSPLSVSTRLRTLKERLELLTVEASDDYMDADAIAKMDEATAALSAAFNWLASDEVDAGAEAQRARHFEP